MPDPSMNTARFVGHQLADVNALPSSLAEVQSRAELVSDVDAPLDWHADGRLHAICPILERRLADVANAFERVGITLRLWAGCMDAAKAIALETRDGPTTPEMRSEAFFQIDRIADTDPIYAAGVEAAPALKRLRQQEFLLEGAPSDSAVRRHES
jgi:hypothetical protein